MPEVYISVPKTITNEGSSFTATAGFRVGDAATAPTTAKYRIDCITTNTVLQDWTSLSVAASISIAVTATHQAIQSDGNRVELKQMIVASDPDTATQTRNLVQWKVRNASHGWAI